MQLPDLNSDNLSTIQKIIFQGKEFYIKRDDLIHPFINGNKARKLQYLTDKPSNEFQHVISWGGAQSNAMYALSSLSFLKGWSFSYFTCNIDPVIKVNPRGNLLHAINNGMNLIEVKSNDFSSTVNSLPGKYLDKKTHIVPMGAQTKLAEMGIKRLSQELRLQMDLLNFGDACIFLSSGTGTTAAFLAKHMPDYQIYTVACVGNKEYLEKQIRQICPIPENLIILESPIKIPFAQPHRELFETYSELLNTGIEFDLIYDAHLWLWIKNNMKKINDKPVFFIHSGGVHGNSSQLERYRRKGIVL